MSASIASHERIVLHAAVEIETVLSALGTLEFDTHAKGHTLFVILLTLKLAPQFFLAKLSHEPVALPDFAPARSVLQNVGLLDGVFVTGRLEPVG